MVLTPCGARLCSDYAQRYLDKLPSTIEAPTAIISPHMARPEAIKGMEDRLTARLDHFDVRVGRFEADVHALRDELVHRHSSYHFLDRSAQPHYTRAYISLRRVVLSERRSP